MLRTFNPADRTDLLAGADYAEEVLHRPILARLMRERAQGDFRLVRPSRSHDRPGQWFFVRHHDDYVPENGSSAQITRDLLSHLAPKAFDRVEEFPEDTLLYFRSEREALWALLEAQEYEAELHAAAVECVKLMGLY